MLGHLLAFLRVTSDVLLITSRKKLRFVYNASFLLVIQSSLSLILGTIGFLIFKPSLILLVIAFCCLSVFFVSISNVLGIYALRYEEYSELTPLTGVSVIYALIIGITFLNQIPTKLQLLGIALVIIGAYFQANEGKLHYPLSILKHKAVLIFLLIPLFGVISRMFMDKALALAPLKDVVIFNLLFSLPIVFIFYLAINKIKFPIFIKSKKSSKSNIWFIPLIITEATSVVLNVVAIYFLDLVIAQLIFSLSILLHLISGKIFFKEKEKHILIPSLMIFIGVVLSIF